MTQIGIYESQDPSGIAAYTQLTGHAPDNVLNYINNDSWSAFASSVPWQVQRWQTSEVSSIWSVPLTVWGTSLEQIATGAYDNYFQLAANTLAHATPSKDGNIYVRLGWEFNGGWEPWAAQGHETAFIQAFQDVVNVFRSVSDNFKFVWDVNEGGSTIDPAKAYPGDHYVDVIGMDTYYNKAYNAADPAVAFQEKVKEQYGLQWQQDFAAAHSKPTAISEWGVQTDDSAPFVKAMADWLSNHNMVYANYWDSNDAGFTGLLDTAKMPNTVASYLQYFTNQSDQLGLKLIHGHADGSTLNANIFADTITYSDHAKGVVIDLLNGQSSDGTSGDKLHGFSAAISSNYADILIAGSSTHLLQGLGGDDVFVASCNGSTLDGGTGNDTVRYDASAHGLIIDLASQQSFDSVLGSGDKLVSIENVVGSQQSDFFIAGSSAGVLQGLGGDDVFVASSNGSTLDGGAGNDTVRYDGSAHSLIIDLASQQTFDALLCSGDKLVSIENVVGSQQSDFFIAGSSAGVLQGLGGDDVFVASSNGSTLDGGTGNDTVRYDGSAHGLIIDLASQQTFDTVLRNGDKLVSIENAIGSQFADLLVAGNATTMTGLGGSDTFNFARGSGHNYVTDFTPGQDFIEFSTKQFSDFSAVLNSARQNGDSTVISVFDPSHTVITEIVELQHTTLSNLHSYDFHFI